MSALGADRVAGWSMAVVFASAAALAAVALWSSGGEVPEHWARARFILAPLALTAAAGLNCAAQAWRRRDDAARWLPLLGGALTAAASILATTSDAL